MLLRLFHHHFFTFKFKGVLVIKFWTTLSGILGLLTKAYMVWTPDTTPFGIPLKSWCGRNEDSRSYFFSWLKIILLASLLKTIPNGFDQALKFAPNRILRTSGGTFPGNNILFRKSVIVSSGFEAGSPKESPVRSLRCWGKRPSGPPASPGLKDLMAFGTSFFEHFRNSAFPCGGVISDVSILFGCFS